MNTLMKLSILKKPQAFFCFVFYGSAAQLEGSWFHKLNLATAVSQNPNHCGSPRKSPQAPAYFSFSFSEKDERPHWVWKSWDTSTINFGKQTGLAKWPPLSSPRRPSLTFQLPSGCGPPVRTDSSKQTQVSRSLPPAVLGSFQGSIHQLLRSFANFFFKKEQKQKTLED